jgi:lysophospholipase L1-like esterase
MMKKSRTGYFIIVLLCLVLVVAAASISDINGGKKANVPAATKTAAVTPIPVTTTVPAPTPTPTTGPKSNGGKPDVPAQKAADDSFFSDSVFIGNSLVDGLYLYGGVSTCHFLSGTGVSIFNIEKQQISDKQGSNCTVMEALGRQQYGKIYIMLGINEISISAESFSEAYGKLVDSIRAIQPNADIYLMSLTPVSEKKSGDGGYFTKSNVQAFNKAIYKLCADKNCWYLDDFTPLADQNGYLPASATSDGIHFKPSYYATWMNVIRTHYI